MTAKTASIWTVNFSPSSAGALGAGGYLVATFPSGFTTGSTAPAVVLTAPASWPSGCVPTGSDPTQSNVVVVSLAKNGANTCSLATSTAAALTISVVNGPAAVDGNTTYSLLSSVDGTAVSPTSSSETIVSAGLPGSGTNWALSSASAPGESAAATAPAPPSSIQGSASGAFMCASTATKVVDLSWTPVTNATLYVVLQAATSGDSYLSASPAPAFSGTSATITYTSAVTEYYKVEAVIESLWVGAPSPMRKMGPFRRASSSSQPDAVLHQ